MKLTREGIKDMSAFTEAGIELPPYDIASISVRAVETPRWVHFGIGNIFRVFIGGIADDLLRSGALDRGLTCVETFDYEVVDRIYAPFDNLSLSVILKGDGTKEKRVIGAFAEAIKADFSNAASRARLKEIFISKDLQLVTFTITEKGYALQGSDGNYLPYVRRDIERGPKAAVGAMGILTAMLAERYHNGGTPIALVSMDNVSHNGKMLRDSVLQMASEWKRQGFVSAEFCNWLADENHVAFPWTMIDKITPRPSKALEAELMKKGLEQMQPVITGKRTYIAPFANAEGPQYLVIEDHFPNGRPALEQGHGVYLADRETVNKCERMKVTACLNPVHSALGPMEVVLGIDFFADGLKDPALLRMGRTVAYGEGMPMIEDPKILSPQAFTDELFTDRFVNEYLGDTNLRLATDVSQGLSVRFGETIKSYVKRFGSAEQLTAIPLGIAGWIRYTMCVDDLGNSYELAPDPMNAEMTERLSTVVFGKPESLAGQLQPILSNVRVFGVDLYQAGLGTKIEKMFAEMLEGEGAVRRTLEHYSALMK